MTTMLENVTIDAPESAAERSDASPPRMKVRDNSAPMNNQEPVEEILYDPSLVFLLEMATSLAIRDEESMRNLSPELAVYCTEILRQRKHLHPILVERTLIYLLALKKRGHETVRRV
jgi:golgi-specific brefeldin A-resistance guanine nucleotide exchange factor 1